jgi:hypothetical protein
LARQKYSKLALRCIFPFSDAALIENKRLREREGEGRREGGRERENEKVRKRLEGVI